jgi:hypothetical protein
LGNIRKYISQEKVIGSPRGKEKLYKYNKYMKGLFQIKIKQQNYVSHQTLGCQAVSPLLHNSKQKTEGKKKKKNRKTLYNDHGHSQIRKIINNIYNNKKLTRNIPFDG